MTFFDKLWKNLRKKNSLLFLIIILGLIIRLAHNPFNTWIDIDESILLFQAKAVLEGNLIYKDIFVPKTPGATFTISFIFNVFGNKYVILGVFLYGFSFILWLGALSTLDVSFTYPLLSLGM